MVEFIFKNIKVDLICEVPSLLGGVFDNLIEIYTDSFYCKYSGSVSDLKG